MVGDDATGDWLLEALGRDGVDTSAVRRRPDTASALMVDLVVAGQFRYLESVPQGALLTSADVSVAAQLLDEASTVIVQLQQPTDATLTSPRWTSCAWTPTRPSCWRAARSPGSTRRARSPVTC